MAAQLLPDAEIVYRSGSQFYEQTWTTYPDGAPLFSAPDAPVEAVLLRPKTFSTFHAAMFWVDALADRGYAVPHLLLPLLPGGRQDRLNDSGDFLFTAKSVAAAINGRRFPSVTMLDPHSDVGPALVERSRVVHSELPPSFACDGVIAPDAGAAKRAHRVALSLGVPLFQAWKKRDVGTGALTGFGIEPIERGHYLVVDDLCDGGGTFIGLAGVLDSLGATADLYVTHGLFTRGTQPLLDRFRAVVCTDSTLGEKPNVTVLPRCASLLNDFIP